MIRVPPDAPPATPIETYADNLRAIVAKLRETGATLVWAQSTPVPQRVPSMRNDDVERYNERARLVMSELDVTIDDLYTFAARQSEPITRGQTDVHLSKAGGLLLGNRVAETIRGRLRN